MGEVGAGPLTVSGCAVQPVHRAHAACRLKELKVVSAALERTLLCTGRMRNNMCALLLSC